MGGRHAGAARMGHDANAGSPKSWVFRRTRDLRLKFGTEFAPYGRYVYAHFFEYLASHETDDAAAALVASVGWARPGFARELARAVATCGVDRLKPRAELIAQAFKPGSRGIL